MGTTTSLPLRSTPSWQRLLTKTASQCRGQQVLTRIVLIHGKSQRSEHGAEPQGTLFLFLRTEIWQLGQRSHRRRLPYCGHIESATVFLTQRLRRRRNSPGRSLSPRFPRLYFAYENPPCPTVDLLVRVARSSSALIDAHKRRTRGASLGGRAWKGSTAQQKFGGI